MNIIKFLQNCKRTKFYWLAYILFNETRNNILTFKLKNLIKLPNKTFVFDIFVISQATLFFSPPLFSLPSITNIIIKKSLKNCVFLFCLIYHTVIFYKCFNNKSRYNINFLLIEKCFFIFSILIPIVHTFLYSINKLDQFNFTILFLICYSLLSYVINIFIRNSLFIKTINNISQETNINCDNEDENLNCDIIDENLLCPITHELMNEPIYISSGVAYEKWALLKWIDTSNNNNLLCLYKRIIISEYYTHAYDITNKIQKSI